MDQLNKKLKKPYNCIVNGLFVSCTRVSVATAARGNLGGSFIRKKPPLAGRPSSIINALSLFTS
jgi:hypothetical protein